MEFPWNLIVLVAGLVVLIFAGLPIAAAIGVVSVVWVGTKLGVGPMTTLFGEMLFSFWTRYTLLALPLFIFLAECLTHAGVVTDLFDVVCKWSRRVPGGLAVATVLTGTLFATLSGSSLAAVGALAVITLPEMLNRGYDARLAVGAVVSSGALAILIPPSIHAVVYSSIVECSTSKMLLAGVIPGILLAAVYVAIIFIWRLAAPAGVPREPPVSWSERVGALKKLGVPLMIVLVLLVTIYTGVCTVTESAAAGSLVSFLYIYLSKKLTKRVLVDILKESLRVTGFILFIASGAQLFSFALAYERIPIQMTEVLSGVNLNPWVMIIMLQIMYLLLGCILDALGMMFITLPIVLPILHYYGFDLIWFGILLTINIEVGLITPPVGLSVFVIQGIAKNRIPLSKILTGSLIFCLGDLFAMALIMIFPQIALWLPSMM